MSTLKYSLIEREPRFLADAASRPLLDPTSVRLIEERYLPGTGLRLRKVTAAGEAPMFNRRRAVMGTRLATAAVGLLLAGCGGPATSGNSAAAAATDPMEAKIDALTDVQRKSTFYKAIYDADFQCDAIDTIVTRPRDNGHRAWTATCGDTGDYYITLQPGGILTVSGVSQPKSRFPKGTKMLPTGTK